MRIGVTGGTGFVGQYLLRDYGKDYDFVVPIRKNHKSVKEQRKIRFIESDYTVASLKDIFKGCDAVIHLAAKGMPKNRNPLRLEDYMPNVTVSASVFETCKEIGITNIIYLSSKALWKEDVLENFINESEIPDPDDEYGVSKLCCDALADFYNRNYGLQIKCYRIGEICGYDLNRGMLNPFWSVLLNSSLEGKPIPIYGKGIGGRDLIYVKDVARAVITGLHKAGKGVYNIGSGKITTNLEIAEVFCSVFQNKSGIALFPEKKEWGTKRCLNIEKAKAELGFEVRYDLFQIVKDIKEEYYRNMIY